MEKGNSFVYKPVFSVSPSVISLNLYEYKIAYNFNIIESFSLECCRQLT